ncbi:hypothetical protein ELY17_09685 [Corynebacterium sp. SY003]|uniref:hypothetical protein n=1 Tax=Corynebacterium sp. SY003 TaxID=2499164 RepID=UPI001185B0C8|nr:hypothetical protein [Corynebacterium sp. SY003]TSD91030.1 hypothetical protein ELY17_09685 [Corynebacterium sp. SY003]
MMVMQRFAKRAAAVAAATALGAGVLLPPPSVLAVESENVFGSWGGANCDSGSTCVKEVGDDAEVTWQVQIAPLVHSEDHIQTTKSAQILLPATVNVTSIRLTHMPAEAVHIGEAPTADIDSVPAKEVDYEVPLKEAAELDTANVERDEVTGITPFYKFTSGDTLTFEQMGVTPSSLDNQPEWNSYRISLGNKPGVYTFEVKGTVKSLGEDTYVPIRVENMLWKCNNENAFGSAAEECTSLKEPNDMWENPVWANTGELPPVMTEEQTPEQRKAIVEFYKTNGIEEGSGQGVKAGLCAITENTGRFDTIGQDTEATSDRYGQYVKAFNLDLDSATNFYGALNGAEDNCDQGFQHITICPPETTVPPTTVPETTTAVSEESTPSKETPASDKPTNSDQSTTVEPSSKVTTPKQPVQSTENEKPEVSETPQPEPEESEKNIVTVIPDKPVVKKETVEADKPQPQSQPKPQGSATVIAQTVKENVEKHSKQEEKSKGTVKKARPKVTTGGHLRSA